MGLFTRIEDAHAITYKNGVYKQAELYERNKRVYVKEGSGFAYLKSEGATSVPKLRYDEIISPRKFTEFDAMGRMVLP